MSENFDRKPFQAGKGFIQATLPTGVTTQQAPSILGAGAFSHTDNIKKPFRTHTWFSNWFWANGSPSSAPVDDQFYVNWNGTAWSTQQFFTQGPIYGYPLMWQYSSNPKNVPGLSLSTPDLSLEKAAQIQGASANTPFTMNLSSSILPQLEIFPGDPAGSPPAPFYLPVALLLDAAGDWHAHFRGADPQNSDTFFELTTAQGSPFTWIADAGSASHVLWNQSQGTSSGAPTLWGLLDDSTNGTGVSGLSALLTAVYIDNAGGLNEVSNMHVFAIFYKQSQIKAIFPNGLTANQPLANLGATGGLVFNSTGTTTTPNQYVVAALPFQSDVSDPMSFKLSAADLDAIKQMAPFAFNFLIDTRVDYEVSTGVVTTTRTAKIDSSTNPASSPPNGTVLCLMPHHYAAYQDEESVLVQGSLQPLEADGNQLHYRTVRGPLKTYTGSSFQTRYVFNNFLPFMPTPKGLRISPPDQSVAANLWNLECFSWSGAEPPPGTPTQPFGIPVLQSPMDTYTTAKLTAARSKEIYSAEVLQKSGFQNGTTTCSNFTPSAMATNLLAGVQQVIEMYFQQDPVTPPTPPFNGPSPAPPPFVMPYFTLYDQQLNTLLMYPASATSNPNFPLPGSMLGNTDVNNAPFDGYGTVTLLNDHFFHYGYFIYAAAQVALRDRDWANGWAPCIDQLAMDIAYHPKADSDPGENNGWHKVDGMTFPVLRYFDAWNCHGWANGLLTGQVYANDIESISEEINAWAALILWGEATGRSKIRDLGIYLYTSAVYASDTYWFDKLGLYRGTFDGVLLPSVSEKQAQPPDFPAGATYQSSSVHGAPTPIGLRPTSTAAQVWGGWVTSNTFFGTFPIDTTAITCVPVNPGAGLYLGRDPDYLQAWFDAISTFSESAGCPPPIAPLNNGVPGTNAQDNSYASFMSRVQALTTGGGPEALSWYVDNVVNAPTLNNAAAYIDDGDTISEPYLFDLSIVDYGLPDWRIRADQPLAAAFVNTAKTVITFVAYNAGWTPITVHFFDFKSTDPIHSMTVEPRELKIDEVTQ